MAKPIKPNTERIIKAGLISKSVAPHKAPYRTSKLIFFMDWCKKCGLCTVICPNNALVQNKKGRPELIDEDKCKLCSNCWRICPDFAIAKNPEALTDENIGDQEE